MTCVCKWALPPHTMHSSMPRQVIPARASLRLAPVSPPLFSPHPAHKWASCPSVYLAPLSLYGCLLITVYSSIPRSWETARIRVYVYRYSTTQYPEGWSLIKNKNLPVLSLIAESAPPSTSPSPVTTEEPSKGEKTQTAQQLFTLAFGYILILHLFFVCDNFFHTTTFFSARCARSSRRQSRSIVGTKSIIEFSPSAAGR